MIQLHDVPHFLLKENEASALFYLRKKVFKDRLEWAVKCSDDKEIDEYDTDNATYLIGKYYGDIICSVRLIQIDKPNMLRCGVFNSFFDNINVPTGHYLEASRLFIDKDKIKEFDLSKHPLCGLIFFSMVNFARKHGYRGIYTIVSAPMLVIYRRSGWDVQILESGFSEKGELVYYLFLPIDNAYTTKLCHKVDSESLDIGSDCITYSCKSAV